MTNLVRDIQQFFQGDVDDTAATLEHYSRDASLFKVTPRIVVFPKDTADMMALVQYVSEHPGLSLTARAGGTDMTGGPLTTSILVVSDRYFNQIIKINNHSAVAQPGVYYRDFEKATLEKNLLLPCYPSSREICTIGGMVANNAGGEKTLAYGKTDRYVREVKLVLRDGQEHTFKKLSAPAVALKKQEDSLEGQIYRDVDQLITTHQAMIDQAKPQVSKNSSGYALWDVRDPKDGSMDLTKLIVGSQGTLGLMTELTLDLVQPKPESCLLVIYLSSLDHVADMTELILQHHPESVESYDDNTFRLAVKLFPVLARRVSVWDFIPDVIRVLTGRVPKLVVLVEFTGQNKDEVIAQARATEADLRKHYHDKMMVVTHQAREKKYWVMRRESFNLLRKHVKGMRTAPFIEDIAVHHTHLPAFLPQLNTILKRYPFIYTIAGHVGDGNFHIIPLLRLSDHHSADMIKQACTEVFALVKQYHGTITGEHNDGLIRSPFIEQAYGQAVSDLFQQTKNIFDPDNIFNPGKKVGSSWDFAWQHLDIHR